VNTVAPLPASVLIVDDTPANLIVLHAVLDPLGVRIVDARSGAEAVELATREPFAVVLVDVQMPEMDGFEVARRLRETATGAELPIIFLTAIHQDGEHERAGYAAGAADYLTKPFDPDMLRARVKAFADLFQQRERLRVEQVGERTRERDAALEQLRYLLAREREARLELENASRMKDEFLASVSHELRTPLSAILGWLDVAYRSGGPGDAERALVAIERNARVQMRIVEDLLDMGRIVSGKLRLVMSTVNVADTVEAAFEAVQPAADAKDLSLDAAVDEDVGSIAADAERLRQVIWNLLSNAIKFSSSGGRVELRVTRKESKVVIVVRDSGQGFRTDFRPFLFEAFRQADSSPARRHGGLGLGLAIVRHLVQAHGGTIEPYSEGEGKGATFTIELPGLPVPTVGRELARAGRGHAGAVMDRLDGLHLLVVDDDEDSRQLLSLVLEEKGASVTTAQSAEEALGKIEEDRPDVLLSDIGMPGVDGYALIGRIRSELSDRCSRTPAIALTAYARPEDGERAISAGFQAHLAKPIDALELTALIASLARAP
jgi:signal transduction histidine kinase